MLTSECDNFTVTIGNITISKDYFKEWYWSSWNLTNKEKLNPDHIEKVIFNPPATIIIFTDGTKEIVKCSKDDEFDAENGFAQAMMNIMFGSRSNFKRFIEQYEKE